MDDAPHFVDSVFHPSDFSAASENAFAHALAIALVRQTEFTILHTGGSRQDGSLSIQRILVPVDEKRGQIYYL